MVVPPCRGDEDAVYRTVAARFLSNRACDRRRSASGSPARARRRFSTNCARRDLGARLGGDVRRAQDPRMPPQRAGRGQRLGLEDVERSACEMARIDRRDEIGFAQHASARDVDHVGAARQSRRTSARRGDRASPPVSGSAQTRMRLRARKCRQRVRRPRTTRRRRSRARSASRRRPENRGATGRRRPARRSSRSP